MFNAFAEQGLMGTTGRTRLTWNLVSTPLRPSPWILQDPEGAFEPLPPPFHRKRISSPASYSPPMLPFAAFLLRSQHSENFLQ